MKGIGTGILALTFERIFYMLDIVFDDLKTGTLVGVRADKIQNNQSVYHFRGLKFLGIL